MAATKVRGRLDLALCSKGRARFNGWTASALALSSPLLTKQTHTKKRKKRDKHDFVVARTTSTSISASTRVLVSYSYYTVIITVITVPCEYSYCTIAAPLPLPPPSSCELGFVVGWTLTTCSRDGGVRSTKYRTRKHLQSTYNIRIRVPPYCSTRVVLSALGHLHRLRSRKCAGGKLCSHYSTCSTKYGDRPRDHLCFGLR